ncbi:MAG: hypothetical protein KAT26_00845 [Marinosulfonomonas sp.]|nr:hypothetical protein [Marinosulfonomonas sp.]
MSFKKHIPVSGFPDLPAAPLKRAALDIHTISSQPVDCIYSGLAPALKLATIGQWKTHRSKHGRKATPT